MWFIDLMIWGLFRLLCTPPAPKVPEEGNRDFIYMDLDGNVQNMWTVDSEGNEPEGKSEFDV